MAKVKVTAYLKEREGREVPYAELAAAGLAPSEATLQADLARLAADPRSGVSRPGAGRQPGRRRPARYDTPVPPPEPQYVMLRLVGQSAAGNGLAADDGTGRLYEIVPAGRLDSAAIQRLGLNGHG
jgi:hypothetical protein